LAWDEFRADHLHRDLRDFYLVHLAEKMNHHAPVNLHDVDLSSAPKVLKMNVQRMVVRLMIHLMMGDQKMGDQSY